MLNKREPRLSALVRGFTPKVKLHRASAGCGPSARDVKSHTSIYATAVTVPGVEVAARIGQHSGQETTVRHNINADRTDVDLGYAITELTP